MSTSMIVIASEQIWPNLLGFLHWHKKLGGINHLFVYATESELKSLGPARRLKDLIASTYPKVMIYPNENEIYGMAPQDVWANINRWMHLYPCARWVINLTGGTKIMTAGLLGFAGRPEVELIYRELGSGWFRLEIDATTGSISSKALVGVDEKIADSVSIDQLIKTQFAVAQGDCWKMEDARLLPIVPIVKAAIDMEWNWRKAFEVADIPFDSRKTGGMLFEEMVASCLLELGINNVVINARHLSSSNIQRQEIDVVASCNGMLFLIDCKLAYPDDPSIPAPVAQIKEAAETVKALGGLNAKALMIRPSWNSSQERIDFAQALGVRIIQRGSTEMMIPLIGEWVGKPLSPVLQEAQALIMDLRKTYMYPYSSTNARLIRSKEEKKAPLVSLHNEMIMLMDEECQDWSGVFFHGETFLLFRTKVRDTALKNALVRILSRYGNVVSSRYLGNKNIYLIIHLKPDIECNKSLTAFLAPKKHRYWLEELVIEECDRQEASSAQTSIKTSKKRRRKAKADSIANI